MVLLRNLKNTFIIKRKNGVAVAKWSLHLRVEFQRLATFDPGLPKSTNIPSIMYL